MLCEPLGFVSCLLPSPPPAPPALPSELLIIVWGLFFIATREESEPKMMARDFGKVVQPVKKIVRRRRSLSVDSAPASASRADEEGRPDWERAFRGDSPPNAAALEDGTGAAVAAAGTAAGAGDFPTTPSDKGGSTTNGGNRPHRVSTCFLLLVRVYPTSSRAFSLFAESVLAAVR